MPSSESNTSTNSPKRRDTADDIRRRKEAAERVIRERHLALRNEHEEKKRKQLEEFNKRKQEWKEKHEKELIRQKEVLNRRMQMLEADKEKKKAILARNHAQSSRQAALSTPRKGYAFGSSTPRELSYLDHLPKEQKAYDKKLSPPPGGALNNTLLTPTSTNKRGISAMSTSLYVPSRPSVATARISPPKENKAPRRSPATVNASMTQSVYTPRSTSTPTSRTIMTTKTSSAVSSARNAKPTTLPPTPVSRKPPAKTRPATSSSESAAQSRPIAIRAAHAAQQSSNIINASSTPTPTSVEIPSLPVVEEQVCPSSEVQTVEKIDHDQLTNGSQPSESQEVANNHQHVSDVENLQSELDAASQAIIAEERRNSDEPSGMVPSEDMLPAPAVVPEPISTDAPKLISFDAPEPISIDSLEPTFTTNLSDQHNAMVESVYEENASHHPSSDTEEIAEKEVVVIKENPGVQKEIYDSDVNANNGNLINFDESENEAIEKKPVHFQLQPINDESLASELENVGVVIPKPLTPIDDELRHEENTNTVNNAASNGDSELEEESKQQLPSEPENKQDTISVVASDERKAAQLRQEESAREEEARRARIAAILAKSRGTAAPSTMTPINSVGNGMDALKRLASSGQLPAVSKLLNKTSLSTGNIEQE